MQDFGFPGDSAKDRIVDREMNGSLASMFSRRPWLWVVLVWALFYLPFLGTREVRKEEGRRATAAREMMQRNDWILPTFHNLPYLNKPPGFYWAIMACSRPGGEVTEWTARLPSVLGTLVAALVACRMAADMGGNGLVAGLVLLITPEMWAKGNLAEIDAFFTGLVSLVIYAFWQCMQRPGSWGWPSFGGIMLSLAVLTKGPAALLFFYGASVVWLVWERRTKWFRSGQFWVFQTLGLLGPFVWVYFLSTEIKMSEAIHLWSQEMGSARGFPTWGKAVLSVVEYPFQTLSGLLPGTVALAWLWFKKDPSAEDRSQRRMLTSAAAPAFFYFWIHGRRTRYALPLTPVLAVATGLVAAPWVKWIPWPRRTGIWLSVFILLSLLTRLLIMGIPTFESPTRDIGAQMTRAIPEGETLYTHLQEEFMNELFYVRRPIQEVRRWEDLPEGETIVAVLDRDIGSVSEFIRAKLYEVSIVHDQTLSIVRMERPSK
jgi:4-amino-4-deoxy-L-arabinose transferase-like glycosyltransferase